MDSFEVLQAAIERVGVKPLAARLNVSAALVYKWCQPPPRGVVEGSGARNPLDRIRLIYRETGDVGIVKWLCEAADGFYVANPNVDPEERDEELLAGTQRLVQHFGSLLGEVSRSIQNDGQISKEEAQRIRAAWDELKSQTEEFVVGCENGLYSNDGK